VSGGKAPHQGYNHNVRHQGHVFHVQTEDSGGKNPHIETHVFYEGIIISSRRTPYADYLAEANPDAAVRRLMQDQHKALLKDLRGGALDDKIAEMLAKHKAKPREETVPFGMKPLKSDPPTGDLPVAAPVEPKTRRGSTPPPATRPPVAAPPVRRHDAPASAQAAAAVPGGTQRAGVVVSRPVRIVGVVPVAAPPRPVRPTASHAAASAAPAASATVRAPDAARLDLDAVLLRYLMEDLERGE
jgi:hypothetical protein